MAKKSRQKSIPPYRKPSLKRSTKNKGSTFGQKQSSIAAANNSSNNSTHAAHRLNSFWLKFVKFGGLSGLGWLGDLAILLLLVTMLGLQPAHANVISSLIAAMMVFVVSREKIFAKAQGANVFRVLGYFSYTVMVIAAASIAVHFLVKEIIEIAGFFRLVLTNATITALAKIVITPPVMISNFLMSRFLSESVFSKGGIHA